MSWFWIFLTASANWPRSAQDSPKQRLILITSTAASSTPDRHCVWCLKRPTRCVPTLCLTASVINRVVLHHSAVAQRCNTTLDRKSTRLNSSHANISYAVFCLKKKKIPPSESATHVVSP